MKKNKKIQSKIIRIAFAFSLIIVFANFVSSQSMPLSVHGTVYELDGTTQVPAGTFISINDTTSGYYSKGTTGTFYNSGRYSASIQGNNGDEIIITASNGHNEVTVVVVLQGSRHNINLFLNTTIPNQENHPPEIISQPLIEALTGVFYRYDLDAIDEDNDELIYSLLEKPERMTINPSTGVIEWTPGFRNLGKNRVIIKVEDGRNGSDEQEFVIIVKMRIRNINVTDYYTPIINGSINGEKHLIFVSNSQPYIIENDGNTLREINFDSQESVYLLLSESDKKFPEIKDTFREVYKYLQLYSLNTDSDKISNVSLIFKVEKKWINSKRIEKEDIGMARFSAGKWYYFTPEIVNEDENNVYYKINADGLDNFVIFVGKFRDWGDFENLEQLPYFVVGTIYEEDGKTQVVRGTKIKIKNDYTKEEMEIATGIGPMDGAYASFIQGNEGDKITIELDDKPVYSFRLKQKGNEIDFKKNTFGNYKAKRENILNTKISDVYSYFTSFFG